MKITAGIVTYYNEETIAKCVGSLIENTLNLDFKLFIIDNNSQDKTLDIVAGFKEDARIEVIETQQNLGFGSGHNQVLSQLDSDVHFVINPDIFVETSVLEELANYLLNDSSAVMITPKILNMDGTEQYLPRHQPTLRTLILSRFKWFAHYRTAYRMEDKIIDKPIYIEQCTGCFFGVKTSVFKEIGGFDSRFFMYFEDADLSRKARNKGNIIFYPHNYAYHRWERANARQLVGIMRYFSSMITYFNKWGWKL